MKKVHPQSNHQVVFNSYLPSQYIRNVKLFSAILIYANNVQSGMGWKSANKSFLDCEAETDDRLTKCIEENSLSVNDISLTFSKGYSKTGQWEDELLPTNAYQSMDTRTHFANHISGMAHLVLSNTGAITEQIASVTI